jgi:hypothetical protein
MKLHDKAEQFDSARKTVSYNQGGSSEAKFIYLMIVVLDQRY